MNKKLSKLIKQNRQPAVKLPSAAKLFNANRFGPLVFLLVFTAAGAAFIYSSSAAPNNKEVTDVALYITPAKQRLSADQSLYASVWVDSKNKPVNAVQAVITYPVDKLLYISSDSTSSQFDIQAETTNQQGRLVIARGSTKPLTGSQLVATITFKPIAESGQALLSFDAASQLLSSDTNTNILSRRVDGRYQIGN